jgi:hypothetical protein
MTRQTDELDRLIDALNAGDATPLNETDDPELADLMGAVRRVRQLRDAASPDARWRGRAVAELARELRSEGPPAEHGASSPEPNHARDEESLRRSAPASIQPAPDPPKRRTISRELAQMAAAIVVLVLVGGVLALVFHEQSGSDQGGIAAGGTPSATAAETSAPAPHLPLTITANGVPVTLGAISTTGSETRFDLHVELPASMAGTTVPAPILIRPGDAQLVHMQDTASPQVSFAGRPPGEPTVSFSFAFAPIGRPYDSITLTISRLRVTVALPGSPISNQILQGPWVFHITPEMLTTKVMPTPNIFGIYMDLSIAQAQQLVAFPIVVPSPLPDVLKPPADESVLASTVGSTSSARANFVTFNYPATDNAEKGVSVTESSADSAVPTMENNAIHWNDSAGGSQTIPVSQFAQTALTITGQTVTRWDTVQQGAKVSYYLWDNQGVHFVVYTIPEAQLTDAVMEQFVSAIIAPSAATPQVQASSTPPNTTALPQSVSTSGLRITLLSGSRDGKEIVLTFKIESADQKQPNLWDLGGGAEMMGIVAPENDISATGLQWDSQNQRVQRIVPLAPPGTKPQPPAPSPTPQPTPEITGYLETIPFVLAGPANQPVTVTVRRVRFEHAPSGPPSGKVISGTWRFAFVPASLPTPTPSGSPTP